MNHLFPLWLTGLALACAACSSSHPQVGHESTYSQPLTSPGAKFGALPPPVQNAIRAETGSAEIHDIVKESSQGRTAYVVSFSDPSILPPLIVGSDGSILNSDRSTAMGAAGDAGVTMSSGPITGLPLSDVPSTVLQTLHLRAPTAAVNYVNKQTWGNRSVYVVSFYDEAHHPKMYLATDGAVLDGDQK